jgi:hypothetical protein
MLEGGAMRTPARCLLVAAVLALGGCGVWVLSDDHPDPMDNAIARAAAEVNLHYALLGEIEAPGEARAEVERHAGTMTLRLDAVRYRMDVVHCDPAGMAMMRHLLGEANELVARYRAEVQAAPDREAIGAACRRYGDDMDAIIGAMLARWNRMGCG